MSRQRPKADKKSDLLAPTRGPLLTPRFVVSVVLVVLGIAWLDFYYTAVRVDPTAASTAKGSPAWIADLGNWSYLIGFGLILAGLVVAAHPSTPLGRGQGVVVGMLGCFLIGLLWICTFYVISDNLSRLPIFDDLGQYNLFVGIAFMAVGFTYATRWE